MYKWVLGIVVLLSLLASFSVIKFGLKPKPIPIIKASNFEEPEKLATYINRQLYQKLRTSKILVFGFDKENQFEKKSVDSVIQLLNQDLKDKMPEIVLLRSDESYSGSSSSRISEIEERYGKEKLMSFTFVNLRGIEEAPEIMDCEVDHTYPIWLECIKKQKVRQIHRGKKVDTLKPSAIVEYQSAKDIMVYIKL